MISVGLDPVEVRRSIGAEQLTARSTIRRVSAATESLKTIRERIAAGSLACFP